VERSSLQERKKAGKCSECGSGARAKTRVSDRQVVSVLVWSARVADLFVQNVFGNQAWTRETWFCSEPRFDQQQK
jgi:transposase